MTDLVMILGLTFLGFALILFDLLFIPGGLLIAVGSVSILGGVYITSQNYPWYVALLHLLVCLVPIPYMVTWALGRVALKGEMRSEDGFVGVKDYSDYIGLKGRALSDLRPAGSVVLEKDGQEIHLDCVAEGGYIERGQAVVISENRGPSLVVRINEN